MDNAKKWGQLIIGFVTGALITAILFTIDNRQSPMAIQIMQPMPTATMGATPTPAPIKVYVNGAVNKAGVYDLPADARIEQLLIAAGGTTENAYVEQINLAAPLSDGMQVFIGDQSQAANASHTILIANQSVDQAINFSEKININNADRLTLETIPTVGPSTADKIILYREDNGFFSSIEEIMNVSGIGEKKFMQMHDSISIDAP